MHNFLIINSSYLDNGKTLNMAKNFMEGYLSVIPETKINIINLKNWKIIPCNGCLNCWFKNPGKCVNNDDFTKNFELIINASQIIFTNPIWIGTGNHLFKIFTERMICLLKPDFEKTKGKIGHNKQIKSNLYKILLFSSCALPGMHNFTPMIEHYKSFEYLMNMDIDSPVLKSQSLELYYYNENELKLFNHYCFNAGVFYAKNNMMPNEILNEIFQNKFNIDEYLKIIKQRQIDIRKKNNPLS